MLETTPIVPIAASATGGAASERSVPSGRRESARNKKPVPMAAAEPPPQYRSEELLRDGEEALILHREEVYRLRRTWSGKLILTK